MTTTFKRTYRRHIHDQDTLWRAGYEAGRNDHRGCSCWDSSPQWHCSCAAMFIR
jgi:hypothetical protein